MSTTLNLADHLLAMGKNYQEIGRLHEANRVLKHLSRFRQLPALLAANTQSLLGEIRLQTGEFAKARRHLKAALTNQPDNPYFHYLMAAAINEDEEQDLEPALRHYRRSLELDPDQPDCLGEIGLLALRLGLTAEGIQSLRRLVELRPDDPEALEQLVEGLWQADLLEESRRLLQTALFRNSRDRRFIKLWNDFQFRLLREAQNSSEETTSLNGKANEPVILPFVRLASPAHPRELSARCVDRKYAQ